MTKYLPRLACATLLGAALMVIAPAPASAGSPPVVGLKIDGNNGRAPCHMVFDASASYDPDGGPVTIEWDFDRNYTGEAFVPEATGSRAERDYQSETHLQVMVHVTDREGQMTWTDANVDCGPPPAYIAINPGDSQAVTLPLTIKAESSQAIYDIRIFSADGQTVLKDYSGNFSAQEPGPDGKYRLEAVLDYLPPGTYQATTRTASGHDSASAMYTVAAYAPPSGFGFGKLKSKRGKSIIASGSLTWKVWQPGVTKAWVQARLEVCRKAPCSARSRNWRKLGKTKRRQRVNTGVGRQVLRLSYRLSTRKLSSYRAKGWKVRALFMGRVASADGSPLSRHFVRMVRL